MVIRHPHPNLKNDFIESNSHLIILYKKLFFELSSSMIIGDLFFIDFINYFIQGNNIYPQCYMIHNLI